jgi:hypothetical protein
MLQGITRTHSVNPQRLPLFVLLLAAAASACTSEILTGAPDEKEPVATDEHPFSAGWGYSWQTTGSSSQKIGTNSNRTCFLQGIAGSLAPGFLGTGVGLREVNNEYYMFVDSDGSPLSVWVGCVNSAAGRTQEFAWETGDSPRVLGTASGRQCFLTSIMTSGGAAFGAATDTVRVLKAWGFWVLTGSQTGYARATARCINVSGFNGGWQYGGTGVWPLSIESGGVNCFLTGVKGILRTPDYLDGVYIKYQASGPDQYFMTTKNKTGWADCAH